jgi:hypothetical protein
MKINIPYKSYDFNIDFDIIEGYPEIRIGSNDGSPADESKLRINTIDISGLDFTKECKPIIHKFEDLITINL